MVITKASKDARTPILYPPACSLNTMARLRSIRRRNAKLLGQNKHQTPASFVYFSHGAYCLLRSPSSCYTEITGLIMFRDDPPAKPIADLARLLSASSSRDDNIRNYYRLPRYYDVLLEKLPMAMLPAPTDFLQKARPRARRTRDITRDCPITSWNDSTPASVHRSAGPRSFQFSQKSCPDRGAPATSNFNNGASRETHLRPAST
ncbi:hypothetical protein X797_003971 [Metarhizium robertsii]|uniref:Uncharacterized protein n=1 Tax=Metarhizium robertsii TaxID=568076 RepID=A0A0A1UZS0_9HYPO|nr:hypothetical protein X797_003971 [Metarhizium robertsii]